MRIRSVLNLIAVLSVGLFSINAGAKDDNRSASEKWKTECVGRFLISVPGDIEIALSNADRLTPSSQDEKWIPTHVFSDNSSPYKTLLPAFDVTKIVDQTIYQKYQTYVPKEFRVGDNRYRLFYAPDLKILDNSTAAAIGKHASYLRLYRQQRIFEYAEENDIQNLSVEQIQSSLFKRFQTRNLFELPTGAGICYPYAFVSDNGAKKREVGIAMRLIEHPDIEIYFQDTSSEEELKNLRPEFKGSRGQVERFWSRYTPSLGNKLQGSINAYHNVKLGGFDGVYAFATIARPQPDSDIKTVGAAMLPNESMSEYQTRIKKEIAEGKHPLDYGYMAYFKGDPNAKEDTPDLMLYVIRTASRATAVGKQPVSEEELKKMAEQIAASIKRRPVKAGLN